MLLHYILQDNLINFAIIIITDQPLNNLATPFVRILILKNVLLDSIFIKQLIRIK